MHLQLNGLEPLSDLESLLDMPLSERLQAEPIGDDLGEPLFQLYKLDTQAAVICRICRRNRWHVEGRVFVCDDHPPVDGYPGRVLDDVRADEVYAVRIDNSLAGLAPV